MKASFYLTAAFGITAFALLTAGCTSDQTLSLADPDIPYPDPDESTPNNNTTPDIPTTPSFPVSWIAESCFGPFVGNNMDDTINELCLDDTDCISDASVGVTAFQNRFMQFSDINPFNFVSGTEEPTLSGFIRLKERNSSPSCFQANHPFNDFVGRDEDRNHECLFGSMWFAIGDQTPAIFDYLRGEADFPESWRCHFIFYRTYDDEKLLFQSAVFFAEATSEDPLPIIPIETLAIKIPDAEINQIEMNFNGLNHVFSTPPHNVEEAQTRAQTISDTGLRMTGGLLGIGNIHSNHVHDAQDVVLIQ